MARYILNMLPYGTDLWNSVQSFNTNVQPGGDKRDIEVFTQTVSQALAVYDWVMLDINYLERYPDFRTLLYIQTENMTQQQTNQLELYRSQCQKFALQLYADIANRVSEAIGGCYLYLETCTPTTCVISLHHNADYN